MTLGQRICALRAAKGLSQEELAQLLEVSRQSVSKWETDASLPELDKLLGLSRVFGLTLDELVKGPPAAPEPPVAEPPAPPAAKPVQQPASHRVPGLILLCFGALLYLILVLLGSHPGYSLTLAGIFLLPGLLCLFTRKHTGLWCAWAVWLCIELYLRLGTGLHWSTILLTPQWTPRMNYIRLAVAWLMAVVPSILIGCTVWSFRSAPYPPKPLLRISTVHINPRLALVLDWLVVLLFLFLTGYSTQLLTSPTLFHITFSHWFFFFWMQVFRDWAAACFLSVALVRTVGFLRWRRRLSQDHPPV